MPQPSSAKEFGKSQLLRLSPLFSSFPNEISSYSTPNSHESLVESGFHEGATNSATVPSNNEVQGLQCKEMIAPSETSPYRSRLSPSLLAKIQAHSKRTPNKLSPLSIANISSRKSLSPLHFEHSCYVNKNNDADSQNDDQILRESFTFDVQTPLKAQFTLESSTPNRVNNLELRRPPKIVTNLLLMEPILKNAQSSANWGYLHNDSPANTVTSESSSPIQDVQKLGGMITINKVSRHMARSLYMIEDEEVGHSNERHCNSMSNGIKPDLHSKVSTSPMGYYSNARGTTETYLEQKIHTLQVGVFREHKLNQNLMRYIFVNEPIRTL